ncbi:MAG: S-adenosyl-l-methionine hydroxide adenosyltransferase family protein [Anaerolineales bacterium]
MLISLTTDFGTQDGYVGVMKGVMAGIAPGVPFLDLTHNVPPQDVRSAAYVLWTVLPYFPEKAVHLVVVDPGVGTSRKALAAQTPWGYVVGPDNGVFSYVWAAAPPSRVHELAERKYQRNVVSATFHGRDIFAPAAAHLAAGVPLEAFGPPVHDPLRLPLPRLEVGEDLIRGEVLYIDHFGNTITSIGRLIWEGNLLHLDPAFGDAEPTIIRADGVRVLVGGRDLGPIRRTYGEVAAGDPLALVGSEGMLEASVSHGHGGEELGLTVGDPVEIVRA